MWLLKTDLDENDQWHATLQRFWANATPFYAILSHTWSEDPDDEVSLADVRHLMQCRRKALRNYEHDEIFQKPGYRKICRAAARARQDDLLYIWIDTCCIDKDSSVELSEAINSMYSYYERSSICYAYLSDVSKDGISMDVSKYFTRGWTLQELLAPDDVSFYDRDWNPIGTRTARCAEICRATQINERYLTKECSVHSASIAERMSWAADRRLSREEDTAYCLLGIFHVNMYQLYGEGSQRAFLRLQEEILMQSEDQSIFAWRKPKAWKAKSARFEELAEHGMLADSPEDFRHCGNIKPFSTDHDRTLPVMTARGLRISLPLFPGNDGLMIATLDCAMASTYYDGFLAVYLRKLEGKPNVYARVRCNDTIISRDPGEPHDVYVLQNTDYHLSEKIYAYHHLMLGLTSPASRSSALSGSPDPPYFAFHMWPKPPAGLAMRTSALFNTPKAAIKIKIDKLPNRMTAVLSIRYADNRGRKTFPITVVFGTNSAGMFGWSWIDHCDADSVPQNPGQLMTNDWQSVFEQRDLLTYGQRVHISGHSLSVSMREEVEHGSKCFITQLEMRPGPAIEQPVVPRGNLDSTVKLAPAKIKDLLTHFTPLKSLRWHPARSSNCSA